MTDTDLVPVADLDRATAADAAGLLRPACASARWVERLAGGRPYGSIDALTAASDAAIAALGWPDIEEALTAHPRIAERAAGGDRESAWSRQEQAGAAGAGADVQSALRAGNVAYEARFGHVFLICATGRSGEQMLAALRTRLSNDPETEREIVRDELRQIVRLRLAKAFR
jgi:2-oxo-4-hydroxy-4-carboxy-5-ureidoimidazoline decarboxylase